MICYGVLSRLLLLALWIDGRARAADDDSVTKELKEEQIRILRKSVSDTAKIKTWYTLVNGDYRDELTDADRSAMSTDQELFYLRKTMNSRIFDLQCTYAYYARQYVLSIYAVMDHFLYDAKTKNFVMKLRKMYLDAAIKTVNTLSNIHYQPDSWMWALVKFMRKKMTVSVYQKELVIILKVLIDATSDECYPKNVPRISDDQLNSISSDDFNFKKIMNDNADIQGMPRREWSTRNLTMREDFLEKYSATKRRADDKGIDFDDLDPSALRPIIIRKCDTYVTDYLKQTEININQNIMEIYYILDENKFVFPYEKIASIHFDSVGYDDFELGLETLLSKRYYIPDDPIYWDEMTATKDLKPKTVYMAVTSMWHSKAYTTYYNKITSKYLIEAKPDDDMSSYRETFTIQKTFLNIVISDTECVYAYFARKHLQQTQIVIEKQDEYFQKNMELISRYYKVSLKTLAAIFYNGYQPRDWMPKLILYFQNINDIAKDLNVLRAENLKMLDVLDKAVISCNPQQIEPTSFVIPVDEIKNTHHSGPLSSITITLILPNG